MLYRFSNGGNVGGLIVFGLVLTDLGRSEADLALRHSDRSFRQLFWAACAHFTGK